MQQDEDNFFFLSEFLSSKYEELLWHETVVLVNNMFV